MSKQFDPYLKWLGVRTEERPPNHYRLLGVDLFIDDPDVIENGADRQMAHLRTFAAGKQAHWAERLLNEIAAAAELAAGLKPQTAATLVNMMEDRDSAVRYWAVQGLLMRGKDGVEAGRGSLVSLLADPSPYVCIVAAETLGRFGQPTDQPLALKVLANHADWSRNNVFVAMAALNTLDQFGDIVDPIKAKLRKAPKGRAPHGRYESYVPRLLELQR